jgi:hypothetical protein
VIPARICEHAPAVWLVSEGQRVGIVCEACAAIVTAANGASWTTEPVDVDEPAADLPAPEPAPVHAPPQPARPALSLAPPPMDPYLLGMAPWVQRQRAMGAAVPMRRAS